MEETSIDIRLMKCVYFLYWVGIIVGVLPRKLLDMAYSLFLAMVNNGAVDVLI